MTLMCTYVCTHTHSIQTKFDNFFTPPRTTSYIGKNKDYSCSLEKLANMKDWKPFEYWKKSYLYHDDLFSVSIYNFTFFLF